MWLLDVMLQHGLLTSAVLICALVVCTNCSVADDIAYLEFELCRYSGTVGNSAEAGVRRSLSFGLWMPFSDLGCSRGAGMSPGALQQASRGPEGLARVRACITQQQRFLATYTGVMTVTLPSPSADLAVLHLG